MLRALAFLVLYVATATSSAQWQTQQAFEDILRDSGIDPASFVIEPGPLGIARFRVHLHHGMSIPCDGPRGCYAKSDLLEISVRCQVRAAVLHRRTSFDLNGNIVAIAEPDPQRAARFYIPRRASLEYRVVRRFCGEPPEPPDRD